MRYAILHHTGGQGPDHYDFMLEAEGTLKTWTVPALDWEAELPVTQNTDHRLEYLEYEGPISGERGEVRRVEGGIYEVLATTPDRLMVRLGDERTVLLRQVDGRYWVLGPAP